DVTVELRAVERVARLHDVVSALGPALTREDVGRAAIDHTMRALGAAGAALYAAEGDADLALVAHEGVAPAAVELTRRFSMAASPPTCPLTRAFTGAVPVWLETKTEVDARWPQLAAPACAAVPL